MMNIVGGDFNNQAAVAAAAVAASSVALGVQPTLLAAANSNDIYNFAQMDLHQQLLQQSAAAVFQNYANIDEGNVAGANSLNAAAAAAAAASGGILVNSNGKPITTSQFLTGTAGGGGGGTGGQQQDQHQQQIFDQMDDGVNYGGVEDDSNELTPKQEIINIDDFVMMTDSNSYDDDADFINGNDKSTSAGIDITQPHGVHDNDLLMSMSGKHKLLNDAAAAAANRSGGILSANSVCTTSTSSSAGVGGGSTTGGGGVGASSLRSQRKTRKIEPVNRPGLVLKTPIAYKGNIDPSVIPIQKDGMGRFSFFFNYLLLNYFKFYIILFAFIYYMI